MAKDIYDARPELREMSYKVALNDNGDSEDAAIKGPVYEKLMNQGRIGRTPMEMKALNNTRSAPTGYTSGPKSNDNRRIKP